MGLAYSWHWREGSSSFLYTLVSFFEPHTKSTQSNASVLTLRAVETDPPVCCTLRRRIREIGAQLFPVIP